MDLWTRRRFMKASLAGPLLGLSLSGRASGAAATGSREGPAASSPQAVAEGRDLPRPTPAQMAWQDCEIGLLYSFDLAIAAGDTAANNAARKTWDPNLYQPGKLDTDR